MEQDAAGNGGASQGGTGAGGGGGGGEGTFVVFTSHREARRARQVLEGAFLPASVVTVAHNRRQGGCFLVHASAAGVEALLAEVEKEEGEEDRFEDGSEERSERPFAGGRKGAVGGGLFEGFVALPSGLKLSPSLLDHGSLDGGDDIVVDSATGSAAAAVDTNLFPLRTAPGKALREEGLVVMLSPGSVPPGKEETVAERWRRDWNSGSLDLHGLSFWSGGDRQKGAKAASGGGSGGDGDDGDIGVHGARAAAAATAGAVLSREWGGAARMVHALAERSGSTPAEACGWDDVRVAAEGPGLMSLRGEYVFFLFFLC